MPQVEAIVNKTNVVALRKLDVSSNGPVVNQHQIKFVPYFILYNMERKEEVRGGLDEIKPYLQAWRK